MIGEVFATALSRPHWTALRDGDFVLQRCHACGRRQHYPRLLCRFCQCPNLDWAPASRAGTVVAAVLTHRTSKAERLPMLPYPIVLVRLVDGPLILATGRETEPAPVRGDRVEIDYAETSRVGVLVVRGSQTEECGR